MSYKINKYIDEYIDIVESGEVRCCEEQKLLVKQIKHVFSTEKIYIDEERIEKYFSYQKYFFELYPWEKFLFVLHNCCFKENGLPRWSKLFMCIGRGAGKNGYLAFEDFCLITPTHGIPKYHIDICANSEDQAKTSFNDIYDVLENPANKEKMKKNFYWNKEIIRNRKTMSEIKFRTNNPKSKDGLRSGKVDYDEIHAYENYENLNVFTTGLGKKPHPRITYATTNGDIRDGVLDDKLKTGVSILKGEEPDNGELVFICRLNNKEQVHDPKNWVMANPSIQYNLNLKAEIEDEYADYVRDPLNHSGFMTKRMNFYIGKRETEVTKWDNLVLASRETPENLIGQECVCGIDFAKVSDFVSVFLLFKVENGYAGIHHSWFCTESCDKERIKIPLGKMKELGILTIVDALEISPDLVTDWIKQKSYLYNIKKIAIDNYRYGFLSRSLNNIGYNKEKKNLKLVRPSDIMQVYTKIGSVFNNGEIAWGDDPLMRWFTNNTKSVPAPHNNFIYEKIEPRSRKTDGFMAYVAAMTIENELPEYVGELHFFDTITI